MKPQKDFKQLASETAVDVVQIITTPLRRYVEIELEVGYSLDQLGKPELTHRVGYHFNAVYRHSPELISQLETLFSELKRIPRYETVLSPRFHEAAWRKTNGYEEVS